MKLIIPMSGEGKRFVNAGYREPKPLIEVDESPMIEHVVNLFPGVENIVFVCNEEHLLTTNMKDVLQNIAKNSKIFQVKKGSKLGPVDVISSIFDEIDDKEEVIVSYCDYGTVWDFDLFLKDARESNAEGSIACYRGFHPHMLGGDNYAFVREKNKILLEIKEKEPFTDNKMNEYASNGTYYFKSGEILKKYFKKLLSSGMTVNGEYYVSLVYNFMVEDNLRVNIFEISKMLQWGTPKDLEIYQSWSKVFKDKKRQKTCFNPPGTVTVLPAAGKGSRFLEEGYSLPKPILPIDGNYMIVSATKMLPQSEKTVFACLQDHIDHYELDSLLKKEFPNSEIVPIKETTMGQACTCILSILESKIDENNPILISACDNGVLFNSKEYEKLIHDENIDIIVWSFRNNQASKNNPNAYAWLDVDKDNFIRHVSCKKFIYDDPLKTHAITGTMFFRKSKYFLDGLQKNLDENITTNGEYYVDDVINQNIKMGLKVKVFEVDSYICWGTPNDYKTYNYWKDHFERTS